MMIFKVVIKIIRRMVGCNTSVDISKLNFDCFNGIVKASVLVINDVIELEHKLANALNQHPVEREFQHPIDFVSLKDKPNESMFSCISDDIREIDIDNIKIENCDLKKRLAEKMNLCNSLENIIYSLNKEVKTLNNRLSGVDSIFEARSKSVLHFLDD